MSGRVQGVYFRDTARRLARELGLVGWVRNRRDGRVEAFAQGDAAPLEQLLAWFRRGPAGAEVTAFELAVEPVDETLVEFHIVSSL